MHPLKLGIFAKLVRTLEQGGWSLSLEIELWICFYFSSCSVLSLFFTFHPFIHTTVKLSLWISPSVLQCTTYAWPSKLSLFAVLSFFKSFLLSIWGVCLSCSDAGSVSESIMIVIVPGGSPWELPRTRVSLGWLTACQLPPPNQTAWGTEISRPDNRSAQIWTTCLSC